MAQNLITKIDELIEGLSVPLRPDELAHGWSEPSQSAMLNFFEDLRLKVTAGEQLPYLAILRGLDHWGISGGELFRKVAEVDYELREGPGK
jgi:hypothetical protein